MPSESNPRRLIPRYAGRQILDAVRVARVVLVLGARQTGKSTLIRLIAGGDYPATVFNLDNAITRQNAKVDPVGFVSAISGPTVVDEIQRVPELLLSIKERVDEDSRPGQFILTGSANVLTAPRLYEALTGRVRIVRLWPLAEVEIEESSVNIVDALFSKRVPDISGAVSGRPSFVARAARGGYPEAAALPERSRGLWFDDYLTTTLDRDLRDIADVRRMEEMPRLLSVLAGQASGIYRSRQVASSLEISFPTVTEYARLLEAIFLIRLMPAWRPGLRAREIHAPKIYFADTGLLTALLNADEDRIAEDDQVTGRVLENFVAMEVAKQLEWASDRRINQYHWREDRNEVDIVLEQRNGMVAGIEVKASGTVRPADTKGLRALRDLLGDRFAAGIVVYTGDRTYLLGDRLWAVPVSGLWSG